MNMIRKMGAVALVSLAASPVFAATDLTAITTAQTDALAVVAALVLLGITVWGANYVRRKFFS